MAKRKKFHGLLTASNRNLTTSETWIEAARERAEERGAANNTELPKWLEFKNLAGDEPEILIYGDITPYTWDPADKSAMDIYQELRAISADRIHLRINSGGGSVFEAVAMFNLLKESQAEIIVHIDGLAGSAAGWLAMVGDRIEMGVSARLMVHQATMFTIGNKSELRADADLLESLEDSILKIYEKRTGMKNAELRAMMDAETYLTPEEALEKGFVDAIAGSEDAPTENKGKLPGNPPANKREEPKKKSSEGEEPDEKVARAAVRNRALLLRERELLTN